MNGLRKHPVIFWGNVPSQEDLQPGHAAKPPLGTGDDALLTEAITFFGLTHPAIQRLSWEDLIFSKGDALDKTRAEIHDALFEYLLLATSEANLWTLIPSSKIRELLPPPTDPSAAQADSDPTTTANDIVNNIANTAANAITNTLANSSGKGSKSKTKAPAHYPAHFNHTTRAHFLLRALLLPQWRVTPSTSSWSSRYQLRPLRWDEIAAGVVQLRDMTRRTVIEDKLKASFGPEIVDTPGGDMGWRLDDPTVPQATLSERIYSQVGAAIMRSSDPTTFNLVWPIEPEINTNGTPFKLHQEVKQLADSLLQAALPWDGAEDKTFPDPFGNWFETLDRMEEYLAQVASSPDGAKAGAAPWGLAMTATLRAYLVDAFMSIFMLSMPLSRLHDQHGSSAKGQLYKFRFPFGPQKWRSSYTMYYSGYLAVGLWECMAGKLAPHPNKNNAGFLTDNAGDELLRVASRWKPEDMPKSWASASAEHSFLAQFISKGSSAPCYHWESAADASDQPRSDASDALLWQTARRFPETVQDVFTSWTAHPRFFMNVKQEARVRPVPKPTDEEDQTGTLFAQLTLFALDTITDYLLSAFGYVEPPPPAPAAPAPKENKKETATTLKKKQPSSKEKEKKKRTPKRPLNPEWRRYRAGGRGSLIGGGSLMWGGCNYSHKEHRWGTVFDITHPFKHPAWQQVSAAPGPKLPKEKWYIGTRVHVASDSDIESLEYNRVWYRNQTIEKTDPNQTFQPVLGMDDIIKEALIRFTGDPPKKKTPTRGKKAPPARDLSKLPLDQLEKEYLLGTPLMYTHKGYPVNRLRVNMIGHIGILLTAPWKMLMASPIMHLRSINLIREAWKDPAQPEFPKIPLFLSPNFSFKPDDHNDHWHVAFWALKESSGDPTGLNAPTVKGEGQTQSSGTLKALIRFWQKLGVQIQDFAKYLNDLELNTGDTLNISRANMEKTELLKIINGLVSEEKESVDYKERLAMRLQPLVELLSESRYVECAPDLSKMMNLPGFQVPIYEDGTSIAEENENERRESERSLISN